MPSPLEALPHTDTHRRTRTPARRLSGKKKKHGLLGPSSGQSKPFNKSPRLANKVAGRSDRNVGRCWGRGAVRPQSDQVGPWREHRRRLVINYDVNGRACRMVYVARQRKTRTLIALQGHKFLHVVDQLLDVLAVATDAAQLLLVEVGHHLLAEDDLTQDTGHARLRAALALCMSPNKLAITWVVSVIWFDYSSGGRLCLQCPKRNRVRP